MLSLFLTKTHSEDAGRYILSGFKVVESLVLGSRGGCVLPLLSLSRRSSWLTVWAEIGVHRVLTAGEATPGMVKAAQRLLLQCSVDHLDVVSCIVIPVVYLDGPPNRKRTLGYTSWVNGTCSKWGRRQEQRRLWKSKLPMFCSLGSYSFQASYMLVLCGALYYPL